MKLRSIVLLVAGFVAGMAFARRMREDDPNVVSGSVYDRRAENPAVRVVSSQAQRIAGRATTASLTAIRRARGAIRERLDDELPYDDAAWN